MSLHVDKVFLIVNAASHAPLVDWWANAIGRPFDRIPVPSCREWDLTPTVLFQVIAGADTVGKVDVSLHIAEIDSECQRLRALGINMPEPERVPGFDNLHWTKVRDPEGNVLNLLAGQ